MKDDPRDRFVLTLELPEGLFTVPTISCAVEIDKRLNHDELLRPAWETQLQSVFASVLRELDNARVKP